jgi:hypothetical protein
MANKTTFTPDEWKQILESVMLSGMAVTAADPSGLIGVLKESMATGRSLLAAKSDPGSNELIRAVLHEVAALLDSKAAADAPGFKTWLQHIAAGAAEAANEGGFMGFGGVKVSEAEKATLAELSSALGIQMASRPADQTTAGKA